jgi:hypothetical protein
MYMVMVVHKLHQLEVLQKGLRANHMCSNVLKFCLSTYFI